MWNLCSQVTMSCCSGPRVVLSTVRVARGLFSTQYLWPEGCSQHSTCGPWVVVLGTARVAHEMLFSVRVAHGLFSTQYVWPMGCSQHSTCGPRVVVLGVAHVAHGMLFSTQYVGDNNSGTDR